MCRVGTALLIPGATFAALITWWLVWATMALGFGVLLKLSWDTIDLLAYGFLLTLFVWPFAVGRQHWAKPSMHVSSSGWTYIFDRDGANTFVRGLSLLYLTAPRMAALAFILHQRAGRLQKMNVEQCGRLMSTLLKADGRVPFEEIERAYPESDVLALVLPLADIDGVVFLNRHGPALTLAPRVADNYAAWRNRNGLQRTYELRLDAPRRGFRQNTSNANAHRFPTRGVGCQPVFRH